MADRPPPQVTMGLLNYVTSQSLDEDYAQVAQRDSATREPRDRQPGTAAVMILGLFGLLLVTTMVQTSRNADDSQDSREAVINQVEARSAQVDAKRAQISEMRAEIQTLESASLETTAQGRALSARLNRLGVLSGSLAVTGPGVRIVVDDAPGADSAAEEVLDRDLQKLANGLWLAGAEAISINGQRLSNLSAIRHAGAAITVNFRSLSRPYAVSAIGNPDTLPARFVETTHGAEWLDIQVAVYGLQFSMKTEESMTLPPASRLTLRHATTPGAPS